MYKPKPNQKSSFCEMQNILCLNCISKSKHKDQILLICVITVCSLIFTGQDEWNMLSITDIVLNHTANESPWLLEHPECAYNMHTAPHLRPAFLLDRTLWYFSEDVAAGKYASKGLPAEIKTEQHLKVVQCFLVMLQFIITSNYYRPPLHI